MVCDDGKWKLCPLQPMAPLLKSQLDSKQFTVTDVIILFRWGEFPGIEGARVKARRLS